MITSEGAVKTSTDAPRPDDLGLRSSAAPAGVPTLVSQDVQGGVVERLDLSVLGEFKFHRRAACRAFRVAVDSESREEHEELTVEAGED